MHIIYLLFFHLPKKKLWYHFLYFFKSNNLDLFSSFQSTQRFHPLSCYQPSWRVYCDWVTWQVFQCGFCGNWGKDACPKGSWRSCNSPHPQQFWHHDGIWSVYCLLLPIDILCKVSISPLQFFFSIWRTRKKLF